MFVSPLCRPNGKEALDMSIECPCLDSAHIMAIQMMVEISLQTNLHTFKKKWMPQVKNIR